MHMTNYMNRVQKPHEKVQDLVDDLNRLAVLAGKANISDEDKYAKLWNALMEPNKRRFKERISSLRTYDDMLLAARDVEVAYNERQNRLSKGLGTINGINNSADRGQNTNKRMNNSTTSSNTNPR